MSIIPSNIQLLIVIIYFFYKIFFRLKPKQYKKCQYSRLFKKTIWKLIKDKVNIYNQQLNFWLNNWRLHNWRSRKPQQKNSFFRTIKFAHTVCSLENHQSWWAMMFVKSPNLRFANFQQIWKKPLVPVVQQKLNKEHNEWWNPKTLKPNQNFLFMDHKYENHLRIYI